MTDLAHLIQRNESRWANAKVTRDFSIVAKRLAAPAAKARYVAVEARTGVRWFYIAVIHEREASQNWHTQLGQGDPLDRVSVHVPAGRGPFKTWEDGAVDALVNCAPHASKWTDWSAGGAMTLLTLYNGLGPENHGVASGYVWAGTNQYTRGKYVRDGVWDPNFVDQQLGCAGLLLAMMAIDPSIQIGKAAAKPVLPSAAPASPKAPTPPATPTVTNPAPGSIGTFIASILAAIFKRKT